MKRLIASGLLWMAVFAMPALAVRAEETHLAEAMAVDYEEELYGEPSEIVPEALTPPAAMRSHGARHPPPRPTESISLLEAFREPRVADDFFHAGCRRPCCPECQACRCHEPWDWHILPEGLIFRSYLAGPKEARFASVWLEEQTGEGSLWDVSLGGRVGVLRWGNGRAVHPEGWQLDIEGAAFPRLDLNDGRRDLISADFRFGVPLTFGVGRYQMKLAYYHLSSHLGDEFIERTGAQRINYVRDAIVWGHSYFLTPEVRVYGEASYAYHHDGGARPWEFQFGAEFAPPCPTGRFGAPFVAINALLQEEHDFRGSFTVQAGWAWRNEVGRLFRVGLHYLNGKSNQFEFFNRHEEQIGVGLWYDY